MSDFRCSALPCSVSRYCSGLLKWFLERSKTKHPPPVNEHMHIFNQINQSETNRSITKSIIQISDEKRLKKHMPWNSSHLLKLLPLIQKWYIVFNCKMSHYLNSVDIQSELISCDICNMCQEKAVNNHIFLQLKRPNNYHLLILH